MPGDHAEAAGLLTNAQEEPKRASIDSNSSASTTSLVFEDIEERTRTALKPTRTAAAPNPNAPYADAASNTSFEPGYEKDEDVENGVYEEQMRRGQGSGCTKIVWIVGGIFIGIWLIATTIFLTRAPPKDAAHNPDTPNISAGRKLTLQQMRAGEWRPIWHNIDWIEGESGEDGLMLLENEPNRDYLVVEDVRGENATIAGRETKSHTLMETGVVDSGSGETLSPAKLWPSKNLKHVLLATNVVSNWRHSFTARYWIFHVDTQVAEPLDPQNTHERVQLASWSPQSDAVVFTRNNNMYLRRLSSPTVIQITKDGSKDLFYGVPDWVTEEEVLAGNSATWWAEDGKYLAFLKTDESNVPEFPVQYFVKRPSGTRPAEGEEAYPEVRQIKYPKAGAPNPIVSLKFYDVAKNEVFEVLTDDEFKDDNRIITTVIWAGSTGKAIIKQTNRTSDILRVVIVDVINRTAKTVRTDNVAEQDGGWFEISTHTKYIPADPGNGRPRDGYIDTIPHEGYDHLAYFHPIDSPNPTYLTQGKWEVVEAPEAIDLKKNLVYFKATKAGSIQRHVYSVKLDGSDLEPVTDVSKEGYYSPSFSTGAGYILMSYQGPAIPWQKIVTTPSAPERYERVIETNPALEAKAKSHDLPEEVFSTVQIDGFDFNVVERRPPHFNPKKKYPVLFHLYGGPASQTVDKKFTIDFQAYVAASLNYIVVTVDGRGTGFIGRKPRVMIRGNIGYYESIDQIETAKIWAKKSYVDESRLAIWGWSYGGFMTLKTLERDQGRTFKYGMAVAPVTDWRYYDSVYTERYMGMPQDNQEGYDNATISDVEGLSKNVRWLMMHGVADDNVHMQNTLKLLDRLDLAGVENYDVHVFPDSDHSIYFHNANSIVYDKLENWLINAFNGEWLRIASPKPKELQVDVLEKERRAVAELLPRIIYED